MMPELMKKEGEVTSTRQKGASLRDYVWKRFKKIEKREE
jgi:hypothetical protein